MMNRQAAVIFAVLVAGAVVSPCPNAAQPQHKGETSVQAPRLASGIGSVHHPVSTKNAEAQKFFDQGLAFVYGFDHESAKRYFEQAAKLDPNLAMAWWGVALSLGPNINVPVDAEHEKAAFDAINRALALQDNGSNAERGYINALSLRYSNDTKADLHQLDVAYRQAMARLMRAYPDDLDAATLYAESMMDLHPWRFWTHDGRPNDDTEEIVAVLESVLKRDPNHLGANHYYIHAIEASPNPERALPSALRLENLAPGAGHLTHMPSHIHARVGDHAASAKSNERAIATDKKFFAEHGKGMIAVMYHAHNLHFLAYASCMNGKLAEAKKAAETVAAIATPHIKEMPEMEGFLSNFIAARILVLVGFERWDELLKLSPPDATPLIPAAVWHFGHTMALASRGKVGDARNEFSVWQQITSKIDPEQMINETNNAGSVFKIHQNLMQAALAHASHDDDQTIDFLKQAVAAEDALAYNEPPAFFPPVRPLLGRKFLELQRYAEAETVFRADLEKNPRYVRSLTGLRDSLKAQGRNYDASLVDQQLREPEKSVATTAKRDG